jgi:hypothetical protein
VTRGTQCLPIVAFALSIATAQAADRIVDLQIPPPTRSVTDPMPRIAAPRDDAERKINAAVQRLDVRLGQAIAECATAAKESHTNSDWQRTARATMHGPGFISFEIIDSTYCGGAHPEAVTMSIVYDLKTGAPVDWTTLLPPSLTGKVALRQGADGTKMITLSSPRLTELYFAGYHLDEKPGTDDDCRQAMKDAAAASPPAMMVWLDAQAGGLAIQFDVPHVIQACADPVVIPSATLRQHGASPRLVEAIEAAHAAK